MSKADFIHQFPSKFSFVLQWTGNVESRLHPELIAALEEKLGVELIETLPLIMNAIFDHLLPEPESVNRFQLMGEKILKAMQEHHSGKYIPGYLAGKIRQKGIAKLSLIKLYAILGNLMDHTLSLPSDSGLVKQGLIMQSITILTSDVFDICKNLFFIHIYIYY